MAKILIVEDDTGLVEVLKDHLSAEHHTVESAFDGDEALQLLRTYQYDVVVLDLALPSLDGIDVLKGYRRAGGNARIIILTGRDSVDEKEVGFEAGADDYLTKPFHVRELLSRIRALMRRSTETASDELTLGTLTVSPRLFQVKVNGKEIHLTPKEFAIIEFFVRRPNQVYSAELLLDSIWPSDTEASTANIKTYMHRLRDKLGNEPGTPQLVTVHGAGYKLELK